MVSTLTLSSLLLAAPQLTGAQSASGIPPSPQEYSAIESLAEKGLIEGYPARRNVFGGRQATRYEVATIIRRILLQVQSLASQPDGHLTSEQWASIRRLMDDYNLELVVIGADVKAAEAAMAKLKPAQSGEVKPPKAPDKKPVKEAEKPSERIPFETIERDYRRHQIAGYAQFRFDSFDSNGRGLFPSASTSGGPAVGSSRYGFLLRRGRLFYSGSLTPKVEYRFQLDATAHNPVNIRDFFADIKNTPARNLTLRVGQFPPIYGTEINSPSRTRETPERAMALSDSRFATVNFRDQAPVFLGQDRDVGMALFWDATAPGNTKLRTSLSLINGEGRDPAGRRNQTSNLDIIARLAASTLRGRLELGTSFYHGAMALPISSGSSFVRNAYRTYTGFDARYNAPDGTMIRGEVLFGDYESTPDRSTYLRGNQVSGFMLLASHPITKRLTVAAEYEELHPLSLSRTINGVKYAGSAFDRQQFHIGLLYRMDAASRLRFWYTKALTPYDPTAAPGPARDHLGYVISELQVDF